ncbi:ATP-grasp domain-containing protein [Hypoxylon sp. FL1150]|nr:ATP-grasp domain-containing protein [Hypoxylon sp. FL1150]
MDQDQSTFDCWWSIVDTREGQLWQSVDVIVTCENAGLEIPVLPGSFSSTSMSWTDGTNTDVSQFLSNLARGIRGEHGRDKTCCGIAKLLLPTTSGHLVRDDIIPMRMVDCPDIIQTCVFSPPRARLAAWTSECQGSPTFDKVLQCAIAGIELCSLDHSIMHQLDSLEAQMRNRLAFPWVLHSLKPKQTLIMVKGALRPPQFNGTGSDIYSTAQQLGIEIVVLDRPGHWLQNPEFQDLIKEFIPLDPDRDTNLPQRIVNAVSQYGKEVSGITTFFESYAPAVAQAALQLGLPTEPPEALRIAADKFETSLAAGHTAHRVTNEHDVHQLISSNQLNYPVIVKPCTGWSSEGVSKAVDSTGVIHATNFDRHKSFVIEEYCSGPEVDANLVLLDGELLLCEISDDLPKSGDSDHAPASNFVETATVIPSKLPEDELVVLRDSLHSILLKLGFRSGMFHLEARVKDSTMEYKLDGDYVDLKPLSSDVSRQEGNCGSIVRPSCWLIEINRRPPGIQASKAIFGAYGIDYIGLGLLIPLQDHERVKALSLPFRDGPQYWSEVVFIASERGGKIASGNVCEELKKRRPDLARHISVSTCFVKAGDVIPPPESGVTFWIAYYVVFSRTSREHVLEISQAVRLDTRITILD